MSSYTSIRGVVKLKEEFISIAEHIANADYHLISGKYIFINEYLRTARSTFIPSMNDLQPVFKYESDFFNPRVENDLLFFRSDLKNYIDDSTGLSPIDSFLINIIEIISDEILLLELNNDHNDIVSQFNFSDKTTNKIELVNTTNKDNDFSYLGFAVEDDDNEDIFEEFKLANGLRVFH